MKNLVSIAWLNKHLLDPELRIFDCTNFAEFDFKSNKYRTASGRENWKRGHIAGSSYMEFSSGLTGDNTLYRNTLPSPEQFAETMAELGIGDNSKVVLYDTENSMWAARIWWMLRWIGFDNAVILDGGFSGWKSKHGTVSNDSACYKAASLGCHTRTNLFIDQTAMRDALNNEPILIVDALSEAQFNGHESSLGLCGHIPGAINIPATSLIDPITRQFLVLAQLVKIFPQDRNTKTIIYCGSGIAASTNAFVMNSLGFKDVAIYMPGLQEWVQNTNLPIINGNILM